MGQARQHSSSDHPVAKAVDLADIFKPHSAEYRRLLDAAVKEAEQLGLTPLPNLDTYRSLSDAAIEAVRELCNEAYLPRLRRLIPGYWGSSCQTLATHLFASLRSAGYDADLVVGEVNIQGNLEYDATLENIRQEYVGSPGTELEFAL